MTDTPNSEDVERAARVLAELDGIGFDDAPKNKQEWTRKGGKFGGRFRDVNEPMQLDFLESAEAVLLDHHRRLAERGVFVAEWQPIETAPTGHGKTHVDLYDAKRRIRVPDCYWHRKADQWMTRHHDKAGYSALRLPFSPTHWLPRPPEPKP